jgi:hypothetical protein
MGETDPKIEFAEAGFLTDVSWFVFAAAGSGALLGLAFSVGYWVFRILT